MDITTKIYKDVFGIEENHKNVNKFVKAMVINFGDERGDIIVTNDNYGTRKHKADFTNGKAAAGLHPMQIVFSGIESAISCQERYIGPDDKIHHFGKIDECRANLEHMMPDEIRSLSDSEIEEYMLAVPHEFEEFDKIFGMAKKAFSSGESVECEDRITAAYANVLVEKIRRHVSMELNPLRAGDVISDEYGVQVFEIDRVEGKSVYMNGYRMPTSAAHFEGYKYISRV